VNILSCVFWPFGLLSLKKFCLVQLPTCLLVHRFFFREFSFLNSLYIVVVSPSSDV
jgi:hypothetical protein